MLTGVKAQEQARPQDRPAHAETEDPPRGLLALPPHYTAYRNTRLLTHNKKCEIKKNYSSLASTQIVLNATIKAAGNTNVTTLPKMTAAV